ncbi:MULTISPECIES: LuxR C-terminal-related transcriptional regulator [unclassified Clostridium]|uniref:LuxR C-terminal-related transcriptional regulator n=1 Tax=unclassified Clostridium TaxID=2614128 RepID=UPI0002973F2D|nr:MULTISPECIES: LuxR C-terminal-related transcriptional regulator [unclassified Clostridium]EKQ55206.1 MAG: ATP-dependent transcriptional regulator [Clostridium sp. Maddingley MBC34-26]
MDKGFIKSKINIPKVKDKLVKREALFDKLNEAINYKLTLVTAPAGFGKSTLISSWINFEVKNKYFVSWISLDERDSNPLFFWKYILYAINEIQEGVVENSFLAINSFKFKYDFEMEIISVIINDLCKLEKELFIVLDDLYLIRDKEIYQGLKYFIRNMPPNVHIIILSRAIPEIGLARLRATDCLLQLCQEDLSFDKKEIEVFFSDVMRVDISNNIANILEKRTEGWAAGLQMAAISLKNNNDEENIIKYFNGDHKFVLEYLMEEVFNLLDKEVQEFLMKTSILDEMNSELCNSVVNIENSQFLLEKLDTENLFIISLDEIKEWYRYHHLFKDFLRNRRDVYMVNSLFNLYNSAAKWYKNNEFYPQAIDFYLKANNYDEAIFIIEKIDMDLMFCGEMKKVYEWYMAIPKSKFHNNLRLCINAAWYTAANGNNEDTKFYLNHIEELLKIHNNDDIELYKKEVMIIRAMVSVLEKDSRKTIEYLKKAKDCGYKHELLKAVAALLEGTAYIYEGEVLKALNYFDEALEISKNINNYYIAAMSNRSIIISKMFRGRLYEAENQSMKFLDYLNCRNSGGIPIAGVIYNDLAEINYEWSNISKSLEYVKKAIELGKKGEVSWVLCRSYIILAEIFFISFNTEQAMEYIKKAESIVENSKLFDAGTNLEVIKQNIYLRSGNLKDFEKFLDNEIFNGPAKHNIEYLHYYVTKLRYYVLTNNLEKGEELAKNLCNNFKGKKIHKIIAEVLILKSIIHGKNNAMQEALETLIEAINISAEENYLRIFINEGDNLKNIIFKLKDKLQFSLKEESKIFLSKIIKNLEQNNAIQKIDVKNDMLSSREMEILKYLQAGLTNLEISNSLFVSVNTVKTHLLNIYTKLDVHSRTEALAKASELGIIKG